MKKVSVLIVLALTALFLLAVACDENNFVTAKEITIPSHSKKDVQNTLSEITIPSKFKKDAQYTFEEGKTYYIWLDEKRPPKCGISREGAGQAIEAYIKFVAKDNEFEEFTSLTSIPVENKLTGEETVRVVIGKFDNEISPIGPKGSGRVSALMSSVFDESLKGRGTAEIRLIKGIKDITVISNTISFDIEC